MVKIFNNKSAKKHQPKKQPKSLSVTIDSLDTELNGIARIDNKITFIPQSLPGEQHLVNVVENHANYNRAKSIKLQRASKLRVDANCPHYETCGGCQLQHLSALQQTEFKQTSLLQLLTEKFALQINQWCEPIIGQPWGYRRKAKLACYFDGKRQQLKMGFRQQNSKAITNIVNCPVLEPRLNSLLEPLIELLSKLSIRNKLGHICLLATTPATIVIRHLIDFTDEDLLLLKSFVQQQKIQCISQPQADYYLPLFAANTPSYRLDKLTLGFQADDFIQVNAQVNQRMVEQALEWLQPQKTDRVLDLFCGLGNFSLPLAKRCWKVVGVEGVSDMVNRASQNAADNQLGNCQFYQANLEDKYLNPEWAQQDYAALLLDPARAGAKQLSADIARFSANKILYISCNPKTFARDAQNICQQGYSIAKCALIDMFPHTKHMELMALFIR